ncbi:ABC-type nitrate/sulfonate/bicarbonate transport system permease component [Rhodococcus sp. 27YEA15]|uniref:ABC transporter permease n=1 Tax=Rhodococcus sp. 27YEA15 TaxID=3156259 RepID=UPI003C7C46F1
MKPLTDERARTSRTAVPIDRPSNNGALIEESARPARRRTLLVRLRLPLLRAGFIALALLVWQFSVSGGLVPSSAVATPTQIATELARLVGTQQFWIAVWDTVRIWAKGMAISMVIAIPVGLILGANTIAYRMCRVTVDFLRTIPPVALIPLALLLYGATETMALVLIVFGSVWPLLLQSMYGVHQVDPVARDVARSYRWKPRYYVVDLVIPSAAPFMATGIRLAATISLMLAIGAQLIGGAPGIGQLLSSAQEVGNVSLVYAYIVVSAILGVAVNLGMIALERRVLRWHPANR